MAVTSTFESGRTKFYAGASAHEAVVNAPSI